MRPLMAAILLTAISTVVPAWAQDKQSTPAAEKAGAAGEDIARGRDIAFDRSKGNCLSCHAIAGADLAGTIGPSLDHMKTRFPDKKELLAILHDETKRNPLTVMPPFGRNLILSDSELKAVADFLYSL